MTNSSKTRAEAESELRAQINASSTKFFDALNELTYAVQPKTQAGFVADNLKYEAANAKFKVMNTVDEARDGDEAAKQQIITVAGISVGVVALLIGLRILKSIRSRH